MNARQSVASLAAARDVEFPAEWRADVARWLRRADPTQPGPGGWVLALLPEFVDSRLRFERPALQVYQRVAWRTALPERAHLAVRRAWCSPAGERSEIALVTEAATGDATIAEALLVARMDGPVEAEGVRRMPRRPDTRRPEDHGVSLVLDREQVRTFARLAGTRHAIHDDPTAARGLGYPDVLVQGAVLLLTVMHFGAAGDAGTAEMWFRQAVPAGSVLRFGETRRPEERIWTVRNSTGDVAAVARLTDAAVLDGDTPVG